MLFSIKATIDRIEGQKAVLIFFDNQQFFWPKEKLPPDCHEGDVLSVSLLKEKDASLEKEELARKILKTLLEKTNEK